MQVRAAGISQGCPPLADPARPLRVQGAQPGLPALCASRICANIAARPRQPAPTEPADVCRRLFPRATAPKLRDAWRKAPRPRAPDAARGADRRCDRAASRIPARSLQNLDGSRRRSSRRGRRRGESFFTYGAASRGSRAARRSTGRRESASLHRTLQARLGDAHDAEHALMEALAETLWEAQRDGRAPDEEHYLELARRRGSGRRVRPPRLSKLHVRFIGAVTGGRYSRLDARPAANRHASVCCSRSGIARLPASRRTRRAASAAPPASAAAHAAAPTAAPRRRRHRSAQRAADNEAAARHAKRTACLQEGAGEETASATRRRRSSRIAPPHPDSRRAPDAARRSYRFGM